jgi:tyrosine-protein kinase Etk/Wzc
MSEIEPGAQVASSAQPPRPWPTTPTAKRAGEGVDLEEVWVRLRDGRRTIYRIAIAFFVGVAIVTMFSRVRFKARGSVYLGEIDSKAFSLSGSGELDLSGGEQSDLASESQILQSESLVKRATLASGLNVAIRPSGWFAPRFLQWLLAERDPKTLDVGSDELSAVDSSLTENHRGVRSYRAVFIDKNQYRLSSVRRFLGRYTFDEKPLGVGKLGEHVRLGDVNLTLEAGWTRGPEAGAVYEIDVTPMADMLEDVGRHLDVSFPKPQSPENTARIITLEFTHTSPRLASSFLDQLIQGYLETHQTWKSADATAAEQFVTNQLVAVRDSLDGIEQKLADYRTHTQVVVRDNEATALIEQIGKYEEQRVSSRLQVAALLDMKRALKDPSAHLEAFLVGEENDSVLQNLASSLSKAREDLTSLEEKYNAVAPEVKLQRSQVDAQLSMIRNYVSNRLARAQENLASMTEIIKQYETKLSSVPAAEFGVAQLTRESEVYSRIYSYLLERQQQAAILKASRISKNRVLDAPEQPYLQDSPKLSWRAVVSLFGVVLGTAFVLLQTVFSRSLQNESDAYARIGALPIVARIPKRIARRNKRRQAEVDAVEEFAGDATSPFAEAFRELRAGLYHSQGTGEGRVVLITSPSASDGKSTTTFALAASLARDSKTVLVVDANMRTPTHQTLLGLWTDAGLSAVLAGKSEWRDAVHATSMQHVYSMPAGENGSMDLLSSNAFSVMIRDARAHFDFVLLDAPSFPASSAAMVLCSLSDCVLSVLRLRSSPRRTVTEHFERLLAVAPYHAVVLNDVGEVKVDVSVDDESPGRSDPVPHLATRSVDDALFATEPLPLRNRSIASNESGPLVS